MKSFYFTNKYGDWLFGHIGNIIGARTKAQEYANRNNELVIIKDYKTHSILECIYPIRKEQTTSTNNRK